MTDRTKNFLRAIVPRGLITPCGFVWAALALCLLYAVCDGLGWREHTAFLSGSGSADGQSERHVLLGIVYAAAYFGFVLVAPILVLAAAIFAVLLRLCRGDKSPPSPTASQG